MDRSLAPMRPSRALQETSHIVFVTSPRNLSRGRGTIDNVDVSPRLLSCTRQARRYRDKDSEIACVFSSFVFLSFVRKYGYISAPSLRLFLSSLYFIASLLSIKLHDFLSHPSLTYFMLLQFIYFTLLNFTYIVK